jgi:hypothetical protein
MVNSKKMVSSTIDAWAENHHPTSNEAH